MKQPTLTKKERHFINYFWNEKKSIRLPFVSILVISAIENGEIVANTSNEYIDVFFEFNSLLKKGYAVPYEAGNPDFWILTDEGKILVEKLHPKFREFFNKLNSSFPPLLVTLAAIAGIVGTVLSVIDYFSKHH